jgi:hypothetical protein
MSKKTPIIMISLLGGGFILFALNGCFSVPVETYFAIAGMIVFAIGLLFALYGIFYSITVLGAASSRKASGLAVPILTLVLGCGAWFIVVGTIIQVKQSLEKRAQHKNENWKNTEIKEIQQLPRSDLLE